MVKRLTNLQMNSIAKFEVCQSNPEIRFKSPDFLAAFSALNAVTAV